MPEQMTLEQVRDALRSMADSAALEGNAYPIISALQMEEMADAIYAHLNAAKGEAAEVSPESTDSARAAIAWVLWHHQGASSPIGQPLRFALGMGAHEQLPDWRIREAKQWAALAKTTTADFHPASPDVVRDVMQFVPDEAKPEFCAPISHEWLATVTGHREGWNACRKEMLERIDAAMASREGK